MATETPDDTTTAPRGDKPRLPDKTGASRARSTLKLDDGYLPLTELARYSGLSVRFLEQLIARPVNPLPHYRFGRKVEVRRSEFDAWAKAHQRGGGGGEFDAQAYNDAKLGRGKR